MKQLTCFPGAVGYKKGVTFTRYYTVGAVAPDLGSLKALEERLEGAGIDPAALLVFSRRRDEQLVRVTLPEAATRTVEVGLSRLQWFEFASVYLAVTAVSVMLVAVHLWTGLAVQAVATVAALAGLALYHRKPRLRSRLLTMGLPDDFAAEWEERFYSGFALALLAIPQNVLEEAQEAFTGDDSLQAPMAVDRRMVL